MTVSLVSKRDPKQISTFTTMMQTLDSEGVELQLGFKRRAEASIKTLVVGRWSGNSNRSSVQVQATHFS